MRKPSVLIIDDDRYFVGDFSALTVDVFDLTCAFSGEEGLKKLKTTKPDVVLLDLRLGKGINGMQVLKRIREMDPDLPVIMVTEYASVDTAVEAMKLGAYHYTSKFPNIQELKIIIEKEIERLNWKFLLRQEIERNYGPIIGESAAMQKVMEAIKVVAPTNSPVLIMGESGTGKELVAREIHRRSPRAHKPFVCINCGALPVTLLESELFGHEKGAFTGALHQKKGKMEVAHEGTLFLDEIADLALESQAKILRALEQKTFERLGSTKTLEVDVRVIAATNKNLDQAVATKSFRQDLYYRLNVIPISIPPLRARKEDIPLLARHFLNKYCYETGKPVRKITPKAMRALEAYSWPGNVRELKNVIERAVVLSKGDAIDVVDLGLPEGSSEGSLHFDEVLSLNYKEARRKVLSEFQRQYILAALRRHGGNISKAAEEIGIPRTSLHRMLRKLQKGGNNVTEKKLS